MSTIPKGQPSLLNGRRSEPSSARRSSTSWRSMPPLTGSTPRHTEPANGALGRSARTDWWPDRWHGPVSTALPHADSDCWCAAPPTVDQRAGALDGLGEWDCVEAATPGNSSGGYLGFPYRIVRRAGREALHPQRWTPPV